MSSPDPAPNPARWSPRTTAVAWAVVLVVGLLVGLWVWSMLFPAPAATGRAAFAPGWSFDCTFGAGDPRPPNLTIHSLPTDNPRADLTGSMVGRRMGLVMDVDTADAVPGVGAGGRAAVVGTVTAVRGRRVELRDCVVVRVDAAGRPARESSRRLEPHVRFREHNRR